MKFFIQLQKANAARREVWGIAALEQPDSSGEIMDYERSKPHFEAWSAAMHKASGGKSLGNIRESHTVKAIGKVISLVFDDVKKAVNICGKIFDSEAWAKVEAGVLTGFSIGGAYGGPPWDDPLHKGLRRYVAIPNEISLVDKPAMPGAVFQMLKADGTVVEIALKKEDGEGGSGAQRRAMFASLAEHGNVKGTPRDVQRKVKNIRLWQGALKAGKFKDGGKLTPGEKTRLRAWIKREKKSLASTVDGFRSDGWKVNISPKLYRADSVNWELEIEDILSEKEDESMAKIEDLLEKIKADGNDEMKALAAEIEAEFKTEEATEGESEAGEQSSQVEKSAPEGGEEAPDEAEKQPESATPDAVKAIVVDILKQLGIVKDDAAKADAAGALQALQKAEALAKSVYTLQAVQKQLTSDVAQLAVALDALEKRGVGIGPVLRDLGTVSPAAQADMQKAGVLRELLKASTDPQTIQALQAEITRLEIKAAQTK